MARSLEDRSVNVNFETFGNMPVKVMQDKELWDQAMAAFSRAAKKKYPQYNARKIKMASRPAVNAANRQA